METNKKFRITTYKLNEQAEGSFDGGRITETKPIGFPGEGSKVVRLGPLFYWAWATSHEKSLIGIHPHKGFEIISYVLKGKMNHYDTLSGRSSVAEGGLLGMQTGSGVSHEEGFEGESEFFQIWLEPFLIDAYDRKPNYFEFTTEDFPTRRDGNSEIKTIIGEGSPVKLIAEARMWDIRIKPNSEYRFKIEKGKYFSSLCVEGEGIWENSEAFVKREFTVIETEEASKVTINTGDDGVRIFVIEVPQKVDYLLYPDTEY